MKHEGVGGTQDSEGARSSTRETGLQLLEGDNSRVALLFNLGPKPQVRRIILEDEYSPPRTSAAAG